MIDTAEKACLGKTEARIETGQAQMESEIKPDLEEMNTLELEASQGKLEAVVEQYNWAPHITATRVLTTQQDWAPNVRGTPKGILFEKMTGAAGVQQWHKGLRSQRVVTSRKQEDTQQYLKADCRAGDRRAKSQRCRSTGHSQNFCHPRSEKKRAVHLQATQDE
jgi:hypothetical protein